MNDTNPSLKCFVAGDDRASENLGLSSIHTLFMREHNRIATALLKVNPTWNDETLFNEARRIVIAEYQHIVYSQYLPAMTGIPDPRLAPTNNTYFTGYNSSVNPAIINEFSTAAMRWGHSGVRNQYNRFYPNNTRMLNGLLNISNIIFAVDQAYK